MDERVVEALDRVLERWLRLTPEERVAKIATHEPGFVYRTYVDNRLAKAAPQAGVSFKMDRDLDPWSDKPFHAELQWHREIDLQKQNVSYRMANLSGKSLTWLQAA